MATAFSCLPQDITKLTLYYKGPMLEVITLQRVVMIIITHTLCAGVQIGIMAADVLMAIINTTRLTLVGVTPHTVTMVAPSAL
jgi:hypothetical protein